MITAEQVYAVADALREEAQCDFLCVVWSRLQDCHASSRSRQEFEELLREGGLSDLSGARCNFTNDGSIETAMQVRFMYASFLGEMLESEENERAKARKGSR